MLPLRLPLDQMQAKWKSEIDPVLVNPLVAGHLVEHVLLGSGANVVNHGLQRNLLGWLVVRKNAAITLYDTQASNQTPALTLNLVASGAATISLWVF